jgi:hypothetical protein
MAMLKDTTTTLIDEPTAKLLTNIANELYHHDYPLHEHHFNESDVQYIIKASYVLIEASKVANK